MATEVQPAPRGRNPFDTSGVERGADGIAATAPPRLAGGDAAASVERDPTGEAVIEVGGERLSFEQLWDRAARVAGGLGPRARPRRSRRDLLANGLDWVLAFWGAQLAGVVAVPVNTRFTEAEVDTS